MSQPIVFKKIITTLLGFAAALAAGFATGAASAGTLSFAPANQSDVHHPGAVHLYSVQLCLSEGFAPLGSITLQLARTGAPTFPAVFGYDADRNGLLGNAEIISSGGMLPVHIHTDTCVPLLVRVQGTGAGTIGDVTTNTLTAFHGTHAPAGVSTQLLTSVGDARVSITAFIEPGAGTSRVESFPAGINCPGACTATFGESTNVYFSPIAAPNRSFMGWFGCTEVINEVCRVHASAPQQVRATFADLPRLHNDLNADRRSDLLLHSSTSGVVYAWQMNGLAIGNMGSIVARPSPAWKVAAIADLFGNGTADIVWHHPASGQVVAVPVSGLTPGPEVTIYTEPNPSWKLLGAGDFNGDGKADLLWRNDDTGDVFALLMDATSVAGGGVIYSEPNKDWRIEKIADFDGDRRSDILWRNTVTGDIFVLLVNGTAIAGGGVVYSEPNAAWQIQAAADFNGDGRADILWRNTVSGELFMMPMNGTTALPGSVFYTEPNANWQIEATGDYDGDGRADIAWRNTATSYIFLMLMNGAAIVQSGIVYQVAGNYRIVGP